MPSERGRSCPHVVNTYIFWNVYFKHIDQVLRIKSNKETRIRMGAALHASPYPKDIIFTTPKMIANYEKVSGTIQRAALLEGIKLYER